MSIPALGDLDGDGIPEIVTTDTNSHVVAYNNKGKMKWTSAQAINQNDNGGMSLGCHGMSIYDLDGDGKPEIIASYDVFSNTGVFKFGHTSAASRWCQTTTAADLDGDGKLEVIFGNAAYHADGTKYWDIGGTGRATACRQPRQRSRTRRSSSPARTASSSSSTTAR